MKVSFVSRPLVTVLSIASFFFYTPVTTEAVVFGDTEFNNANWTLNILANTGGTITAGQMSPGGNPGNYRDVTNTGLVDPATIFWRPST